MILLQVHGLFLSKQCFTANVACEEVERLECFLHSVIALLFLSVV